jgi:hypothetical protein
VTHIGGSTTPLPGRVVDRCSDLALVLTKSAIDPKLSFGKIAT